MCVRVFGFTPVSSDAHGGHMYLIPIKLVLQAVVSSLVWLLGSEPGKSKMRAAKAIRTQLLSPHSSPFTFTSFYVLFHM